MQPTIIWLTLDSVRADHTSLGGYSRETTPNLARIANTEGGWHSKRCIAAGTGTSASSGSILTGTYPFRHGISTHNEFIPESLSTAPELFSEAGYETACLSRNSYLSSGTGLDRGFDRFEWIAGSTLPGSVPTGVLLRYLLTVRSHSAGLTTDTAKHATPYLINETAKRWLADLNEPYFFYLHYNEPHRPYYPPLPYLDRFTDDIAYTTKEAADVSMEIHDRAHEHIGQGLAELTEADLEALVAMYDAEIAYTDEMVGRLFDHVQSLEEDVVFVVTADHGELFGERDLLSHKLVVDDALVNVPLVVHGLDALEYDPDRPIQHIDLMETLLAMAGGDTGQFDGIDLRTESREWAIVNRGEADFGMYSQYDDSFDGSGFHESAVTAAVGRGFRYERSDDFTRLYRLPDEHTGVSAAHPDLVAKLEELLDEWAAGPGQPILADRESQLSEDMRRQLRDLGYVE